MDIQHPQTSVAFDEPAQAIRDRLRDAIIDRRLSPGTKLTEQEIGALFSAGRTVVRSALQMLAFEGLVRSERNRGAFVAYPSPDDARQVFASRRLIEPGLATAACARVTADDIAAFHQQLAAEAGHLAAHGPDARRAEIKASGDFHLLLAQVAGNAILARFMAELVARSSLVIALYGRSGASTCGHNEHRAIVDALREGNADAAQALVVAHLDHIEADLDLRPRAGTGLRQALAV